MPLVVVTVLLFVALLVGLVLLQVRMSRRFRRTLNVPLVGATVLVVAATVWLVVALVAQGSDIAQAKREGPDPIGVLTQASILSQRLRADDELTLVTRDAVPTYQADYKELAPQLDSLIDDTAQARSGAYQACASHNPQVTELEALHQQIRLEGHQRRT